jgi:hypothetical protein
VNAPSRRVLLSDDDYERIGEIALEFYLTYAGPLYATQREARPGQPSRHRENKKLIRAVFHKQLRTLWAVAPSLRGASDGRAEVYTTEGKDLATDPVELAKKHSHFGFNFVPLVTQELDLLCSIEIFLLRPDRPGSVVWAGDIDNRIKTLLDAMRIPEADEGYSQTAPTNDEKPFYCLLEEDKLITKVSVETDRLLEPVSGDNADVRLFIKVGIKPYLFDVHTMKYA